MLKVLEGLAFLEEFCYFWAAKVDFNEIWVAKAPPRHPKCSPLGHLGEALGHLGAPLGGLGCPWGPLGAPLGRLVTEK